MKDYIIRQVLTKEQLTEITKLTNDPTNIWVDGLISTVLMDNQTKSNTQLSKDCNNYQIIKNNVMQALDQDKDFYDFIVPHTSTAPIISRYTKDSYYNIHEDDPNNGTYSTTIFLSDPETYISGELCLYLNGKEEEFKLPAGYAITYHTGILHKVNKIDEGERHAIVLWTTTLIQDQFLRELICDLEIIKRLLIKKGFDKYQGSNFELYENDPLNSLHYSINKIKRHIKK